MSSPRASSAGRTWPVFIGVLAIVAAIAGIELYAVLERGRAHQAPPAAAAPAAIAEAIQGDVDLPRGAAIRGPRISISGWALDRAGIRSVEVRVDGRAFAARYGIARADVANAKPGYPDSASAGFEWQGDLSVPPAAPGVDHRPLQVVAIARDGRERVLATRDVIETAAALR